MSLGKVYGRLGPSFRRICQSLTREDVLLSSAGKRSIQTHNRLDVQKLEMPALSPTMTKGNIIKWHKKEGEAITPGDILCEIETDKAVIAMDTEEEGILAKIIAPDNSQDIDVGQLIALLVEEGEDWKNVEVPAGGSSAAPAPSAPQASQTATGTGHQSNGGHLVGPSVKKLLQEYAIDSSSVTASGPNGALLKGDVLSYIKTKNLSKVEQKSVSPSSGQALQATPSPSFSPQTPPPPSTTTAPSPAASSNYVDIPLSNMRRTIAKRLTESKTTIPHAYSSIASNMDAVVALRKSLATEGVKVSVNDFIIKATAMALKRVPQVNGIWSQDSPQLMNTVDISVAVATPNGLITPIVRSANHLTLQQIGDTVKEMAGRAKEGKLKPKEYQGGSFSISNLGMFGISEFTAVINPPQMAIMAVGTSRTEATLQGNTSKMTVTISYDSRAIDPVDITLFLEEFRHVMENPTCMLAGQRQDSVAEAFAF